MAMDGLPLSREEVMTHVFLAYSQQPDHSGFICVGLVVVDAVCRVPKLTSVVIVCSMRAGSIWEISDRISESVVCGTSGTPTLAGGQVPAPQLA